MNKISIWILIFACLCSVIIAQSKHLQQVKNERDLYQNNTESLLLDIEILRRDSIVQAYQSKALTLSIDEFKRYREQDANVIKDLKLKLKQVTSISKQSMEVKVPVNAPVKDTVVIINNVVDTIKSIKYVDRHVTFDGYIRRDSMKADIKVPVTITQVIHKVPKRKFLWWSWGCKAIKQVIITDNPYVQLNYSEYIQLK